MTAIAPTSSRIDELEAALATMPQAECPVRHTFTPGLYARTVLMPAGAVVTSKIHKTEHPWVLSAGRLSVYDHETGEWTELAAPAMGVTKPGTRRVAVIHEDTIWTTFHPTDLTDVDAIEAQIIVPHTEHIEAARKAAQLQGARE